MKTLASISDLRQPLHFTHARIAVNLHLHVSLTLDPRIDIKHLSMPPRPLSQGTLYARYEKRHPLQIFSCGGTFV